jgi:phosphoglycerol transferase
VFKEAVLPPFIKSVSGFSVAEQWGRWTDGGIAPSAGIEFASALPENLKLRLELMPFGPNANQPTTIRFGDYRQKVILKPGMNVVVLELARSGTPVTGIEVIPFSPVTPESLGLSEDKRKLGVGLVKMEAFE